jgi:hypothetical protein
MKMAVIASIVIGCAAVSLAHAQAPPLMPSPRQVSIR